MNEIMIAVIVVVLIGLICGLVLSVASKILFVPTDDTVAALRECLPGANCGACGFAGCDKYAENLASDPSIGTNKCIPGGQESADKLAKVLGIEAAKVTPMVANVRCSGTCTNAADKYEWQGENTCAGTMLLFGGKNVCSYGCLGYGDCAKVCEKDAISIIDGLSVIDTDKCMGCASCAKVCPTSIIEMIPKTAKVAIECSNKDKGKAAMNACKLSCIACGKCAKVCEPGAITMSDNLPSIDYDKCIGCGACVEGCPRKCIHLL